MSWEFDNGDKPQEPRDRTKLVWGAILIGLAVMAGILALSTRESGTFQSRVYVKHIFIERAPNDPADRDRALELATDIRRRILAKKISFEDAARNYSAETATASKGGHMGWRLEKEFATGVAKDFAWNGPVGELSPVLESNVGFHLLFVEKRELSAAEQYQRDLKERLTTRGVEISD